MHNFEEINKKYDVIIKMIYDKYFYVNIDYELYKNIVIHAYEKAEKEKSNDSKYFLKCLNLAMKAYIKTMFEDIINAYSILNFK